MAETNLDAPGVAVCWPKFTNGQTIAGMKLLDLIDWVRASNRVLSGGTEPEDMPIIAMPPVQRDAVWRPKQVLDLWDSLMRGLPIGTFYLVEQRAGIGKLVRLGGVGNPDTRSRTQDSTRAGFELLDGQQRVRALLAGVCGPAEGKLCLWVDLGAERAKQSPCLRVTSKAQPFGYDGESSGKLPMDQRRNARRAIEPYPEKHPLRCGDRPAYDLDLFDGDVTKDDKRIEQPPHPYAAGDGKTFTRKTFKLHDLFSAWQKRSPDDSAGGIEALRCALPEASRNDGEIDRAALCALHKAFQKIEEAQVALLRIDPNKFGDKEGKDRAKTLLTLFVRIGAGGTPLSAEERLFSIYKHHVPEIRDAVDAIYDRAGRVLPPTKIVATALRIANASATDPDRPQYTVPSADDFSKSMSGDTGGGFRERLDHLILGVSTSYETPEGVLSESFDTVKKLLSYADNKGAFWLPDVLIAALPAELWQVLVFWVAYKLKHFGRGSDFEPCREELVRFALFWHVFVWNNEKAAKWAFADIRNIKDATRFPSDTLYRRFVGSGGGESCAHGLIEPSEFEKRLFKESSHNWRTDKERFGDDKSRNEIGAHWWWSGRKVLPWLQRAYIKRVFPGYAPLTDHEDDLPYDLDHICPYKDWGDHWLSMQGRFENVEDSVKQRMQNGRSAIGNGIGNLRLIDASANRHDQDVDVSEKMCFIQCDKTLTTCDERAMTDWAFPPDHRALWKKVSRSEAVSNRKWDKDRLAAFQHAVEQRAAWLYQKFHDELGFGAWTSVQRQNGAHE